MNIDRTIKLWWLAGFTLFAFSASILILNNLPPSQEIQNLAIVNSNKGEVAPRQEKSDKNISVPIGDSYSDQKPIFMPQETKEIREWLDDKGYLSNEDLVTYGNYSDKLLESLAKNNDWRAIMFLANKYSDTVTDNGLSSEDRKANIEKAKSYWRKAAVLGSTLALDHIATFMDIGLDDPTKRSTILDILAIYKIIEKRGDIDLATSSRKYFINERKVVLSMDEEKIVDQRAVEFYGSLNSERATMGLHSFDNGMADSVKRFFGINP